MSSPEVCVLKTDGVNCDEEMAYAFEVAGAQSEVVHVNELRSGERRLGDYGILALPGGFSYGDDIASGKVLANELTSQLSEMMEAFVEQGKPVIGVCNGFQVLTRTGLLPNRSLGQQQVTLAENEVGRFECRWIDLAVGPSVCKFVQPEDFAELPIPMQTAHGEGRFFGSDESIRRLQRGGQVVFRYATSDLGGSPMYPENPNGAIDDIAGICDPSGLVLGMMPHPERSIDAFHPHRVRTDAARNAASTIFSNIVAYSKES
jgi:phosphoribosylformylglycinamidine synthase